MASRVRDFFRAYRGFQSDAKKLVVTTLFGSVGDSTVWFLLPLYFIFLGYSKVELGTLIFLQSICMVLPMLPAGYISDRFGRRRMIFIGIFVRVIGLVFLIRADNILEFYLGAAVWGLAHSMYVPSFMGFLSEKVEEQRRKYLFGFQMFASMLASASAILVIGYMPDGLNQWLSITVQNSYRWIFFMGLCFTLTQLIPLAYTSVEHKDKVEDQNKSGEDDPDKKACLPTLPKRTLLMLCIPMALFGLGAGLIVPFFQVYFQWRFGTSVSDIGILFSFTNYLWAFAYLLIPNLADRKGSVLSITMVHTAAVVALLAIPVSPGFYFVAVAYIARMVLMNSTWPVFQSYSLSQVPDEHRSFTLSSTNFSFNLTKAITPLIAGFLFEMSLELPFFLTAILYIMATVLFFIFFRRKDDKTVSEEEILPHSHEEDV